MTNSCLMSLWMQDGACWTRKTSRMFEGISKSFSPSDGFTQIWFMISKVATFAALVLTHCILSVSGVLRYCFLVKTANNDRKSWVKLGVTWWDKYVPQEKASCNQHLQQEICITHSESGDFVERQVINRGGVSNTNVPYSHQRITLSFTGQATTYHLQLSINGNVVIVMNKSDTGETATDKFNDRIREHLGPAGWPHPLAIVEVTVAATGEIVLSVIFHEILGEVPIMQIVSTESVGVSIVPGSSSNTVFHTKRLYYFQIDGTISRGMKMSSKSDRLCGMNGPAEKALKVTTGYYCQIYFGPESEILYEEDYERPKADYQQLTIRHLDDDEGVYISFSGHQYVENAGVFYTYEATSGDRLIETNFKLCLSSRDRNGQSGVNMRFSYEQQNNQGQTESETISVFPLALHRNWVFACVNLHQMAMEAIDNTPVNYMRLLELWFTKEDENVSVDVDYVFIGIFTYDAPEPYCLVPANVSSGERITKYDVICPNENLIEINMTSQRCADNFPLFKVAEVQSGDASGIQILRTNVAKAPVTGQFTLHRNNCRLQIDAQASALELQRAIQSCPGVGRVVVTKNSNCEKTSCWTITFLDEQPFIDEKRQDRNLFKVEQNTLQRGAGEITTVRENTVYYEDIPPSCMCTVHDNPQVCGLVKGVPTISIPVHGLSYNPGTCCSLTSSPNITIKIDLSNKTIVFVVSKCKRSQEAWVHLKVKWTDSEIKPIQLPCDETSLSGTILRCNVTNMSVPQGMYDFSLRTANEGFSNYLPVNVTTLVTADPANPSGSNKGGGLLTLKGPHFHPSAKVYFKFTDQVYHVCERVPGKSNQTHYVCSVPPQFGNFDPTINFTSGNLSEILTDITYTYQQTSDNTIITNIDPQKATVDGLTEITITGINLIEICRQGHKIYVGLEEAEKLACKDTYIVIKAPAHKNGRRRLFIETGDGYAPMNADVDPFIEFGFTITSIDPPTITSIQGGAFIRFIGCCFSANNKCSHIRLESTCSFRLVSCSMYDILAEVLPQPKTHICENKGTDPVNGLHFAWVCTRGHIAPGDRIKFKWRFPSCQSPIRTEFAEETNFDKGFILESGAESESEVAILEGTQTFILKVIYDTDSPMFLYQTITAYHPPVAQCSTQVWTKQWEAQYDISPFPVARIDPEICDCSTYKTALARLASSGAGQTVANTAEIFPIDLSLLMFELTQAPGACFRTTISNARDLNSIVQNSAQVDLNDMFKLPDDPDIVACDITTNGNTRRFPAQANQPYPNNINCYILLEIQDAKKLVIRMIKFDLQHDVHCLADYTQFHDGPSRESQVMGRYCGYIDPYQFRLQATGNKIYIHVHTDASIRHGGIEIELKGDKSFGGPPGVQDKDSGWFMSNSMIQEIIGVYTADVEDEEEEMDESGGQEDWRKIADHVEQIRACWDTEKKYCTLQTTGPGESFTCISPLDRITNYIYYGLNKCQSFVAVQPPGGQQQLVAYLPSDPIEITISTTQTITIYVYYLHLCGNTYGETECESDLKVIDNNDNVLKKYCSTDQEAFYTQEMEVKLKIKKTDIDCVDYYIIYTAEGEHCGTEIPYPHSPKSDTCGYPSASALTPTSLTIHNYVVNQDCTYIITADNDEDVILTVLHFSTEHDVRCENDFLEIHESICNTGKIISRMCGQILPGLLNLKVKLPVCLWFRSNEIIQKAGFKLVWGITQFEIDASSGGTFDPSSDGSGYVSSPNAHGFDPEIWHVDQRPTVSHSASAKGPYSYVTRELYRGFTIIQEDTPDNLLRPPQEGILSMTYPQPSEVEWRIIGGTDCNVFRYNIEFFVVTHEDECEENRLEIEDHTGTVLRELCRSMYSSVDGWSDTIVTESLVFKITTRDPYSYISYLINYENICSVRSIDVIDSGTLCPVGNIDHDWKFMAPDNYKLMFFFVLIHHSKQNEDSCADPPIVLCELHDDVEVDLKVAYTAKEVPGPYTTGKEATLHIMNAGSDKPDICVKYHAYPDRTIFNDPGQVIASHGFPLACETSASWVSYTVGSGTSDITIIFLAVSLDCDPVDPDQLRVLKNDNTEALPAGCWDSESRIPPLFIDSTKTPAKIQGYFPPGNHRCRGFLAVYFEHGSDCGRWYNTDDTGEITINAPAVDRSCLYVFDAGIYKPRLIFSVFNVGTLVNGECTDEFIDIFESYPTFESGTMGNRKRFCGTGSPATIEGSDRYLLLVLTSAQNSQASLTLEFTQGVCGGELTDSDGYFTSPGFPDDQWHQPCEVTLTPPIGLAYLTIFYSTDMTGTEGNCDSVTRVEIRMIGSSSENTTKICSSASYGYFTSDIVSHTVHIKFIRVSVNAHITMKYFFTQSEPELLNDPWGVEISLGEENPITAATKHLYIIEADDINKIIKCTFLQFDVGQEEYDGFCSGSVSMHDTSCIGGEQRNCGQSLPKCWVSVRGKLAIYMDADVGDEFRVTCEVMDNPELGTIFIDDMGIFHSQGFPRCYPNSQDVNYYIQPSVDTEREDLIIIIELTMDVVCPAELQIYEIDSTDTSNPLTDALCNEEDIILKWTNQKKVKITLRTDIFHQGRGFIIDYKVANTKSEWGGDIEDEYEFEFSTPSFPALYPSNIHVFWTFKHLDDVNKFTLIMFSPFHLEYSEDCEYDSVEIFAESPIYASTKPFGYQELNQKLCGRRKSIWVLIESTELQILFSSDDLNQRSGFQAQLRVYTRKPHGEIFDATSGVMFSPNYPRNYQKDLVYIYYIHPSIPGEMIYGLIHYDIDVCDTIIISHNSGSVVLYEYTGSDSDAWSKSTADLTLPLKLEFITDATVQRQGFQFRYFTDTLDNAGSVACGEMHEVSSTLQEITSPGYRTKYDGNLACTYVITGNSLVSVAYDIQPTHDGRCSADHIQISNNGYPPIGAVRYCGVGTITVVSTTKVFIRFITVRPSKRKGFKADFIDNIGHGRMLGGYSGGFASPDDPHLLDKGSTYLYIIEKHQEYEMTIKCGKIYLGVRTSQEEADRLLLRTNLHYSNLDKVYGHDWEDETSIVTSYLMILFVSGNSATTKGFQCSYKISTPRRNNIDLLHKNCKGQTDVNECGQVPPSNPYVDSKVTSSFMTCVTPVVREVIPSPPIVKPFEIIILRGDGFSDNPCLIEVMIADVPCEVLEATKNEIQCQVSETTYRPGGKNKLKVRVHNIGYARMLVPPEDMYVTICPEITDCTPHKGSTEGGTVVTINGRGFAADIVTDDDFWEVKVGTTMITDEYITYKSHTQVVFLTPPGLNPDEDHPISLSLPLLYGNGTIGKHVILDADCYFKATSDKTPLTNYMFPDDPQIQTSTKFTLLGYNLPFMISSSKVELCEEDYCYYPLVTAATEYFVQFFVNRLPHAEYQVRYWSADFGYAQVTHHINIAFHVSNCAPLSGSEKGGTEIQCTSNGSPIDVGDVTVKIGVETVENLRLGDPIIRFSTPPGSGTDLDIVFTSGEEIVTIPGFDYVTPPTVTSIEGLPDDCSATTFTLLGDGFSTVAEENDITIGGLKCDVRDDIITTSELKCDIPRQLGAGSNEVMMKVSNMGKAMINTPTIQCDLDFDVHPSQGSPIGGQYVTIQGKVNDLPKAITGVKICNENAPISWKLSDPNNLVVVTPRSTDDKAQNCQVEVTYSDPENGETSKSIDNKYEYVATECHIQSVQPVVLGTEENVGVTISGTNLRGVRSIDLGCVLCDEETGGSDTQFTCGTKRKIFTELPIVDPPHIKMENDDGLCSYASGLQFKCYGSWNSPSSWPMEKVPMNGEEATIPAGMHMILKGRTERLKELIVKGKLIFSPDDDAELRAERIVIPTDGHIQAGCPGEHKPRATITLSGDRGPGYGRLVLDGGKLTLCGESRKRYTRLAGGAGVGDMMIEVEDNVDWTVGSEINIAAHYDYRETEKRTIRYVDNNKIHLEAPLSHSHKGTYETITKCGVSDTVYFGTEVGLLSSNILIQGDPYSWESGGAVHVRSTESFQFKNVEMARVGQPSEAGIAAVFFDNANGDQGCNCEIEDSSIHDTYNGAVDICCTSDVTLRKNVIHSVSGNAINANSGGNNFLENLITKVKTSSMEENAGIKTSSALNIIKSNIVAGYIHGFVFDFSKPNCTITTTPSPPCKASPDEDNFDKNIAHSCGGTGIMVINGVEGCDTLQFTSMTSWRCNIGAVCKDCCHTTFNNFLMVSNMEAGVDISTSGPCSGTFYVVTDVRVIGKTKKVPVRTTKNCLVLREFHESVKFGKVWCVNYGAEGRAAVNVETSGNIASVGCRQYDLKEVDFCGGNMFDAQPGSSAIIHTKNSEKYIVGGGAVANLVKKKGGTCNKQKKKKKFKGQGKGGSSEDDVYQCSTAEEFNCLQCWSKKPFQIFQGQDKIKMTARWLKTPDPAAFAQGAMSVWINSEEEYTINPACRSNDIYLNCSLTDLNTPSLDLTLDVSSMPELISDGDLEFKEVEKKITKGVIRYKYNVKKKSASDVLRFWIKSKSSSKHTLEDLDAIREDANEARNSITRNTINLSINKGQTWCLNGGDYNVDHLVVKGKLVVLDNVQTILNVVSLVVEADGVFLAGTKDRPLEGSLTINLVAGSVNDQTCKMNGPHILVHGTWSVHGKPNLCRSELSDSATVNSVNIKVLDEINCENVQESKEDLVCCIPAANYRGSQTEKRQCTCTGYNCVVTSALEYDHNILSPVQSSSDKILRPELAILNRKILISGSSNGGSILVVAEDKKTSGHFSTSHVEHRNLGQNTNGAYRAALTFCNFDNGLDAEVEHCSFWDIKNTAIELLKSTNIVLANNTVCGASAGISDWYSTNTVIDGNHIFSTDQTPPSKIAVSEAVSSDSTTDCAACSTTLETSNVGINLRNSGYNVKLTRNRVVGSKYGIVLNGENSNVNKYGKKTMTMLDNVVTSAQIGVYVVSPSIACAESTCSLIHSFTVAWCSQVGILIKQKCCATVDNCWLAYNKVGLYAQLHACPLDSVPCSQEEGVPGLTVSKTIFDSTSDDSVWCPYHRVQSSPSFCELIESATIGNVAVFSPVFLKSDSTTDLDSECQTTSTTYTTTYQGYVKMIDCTFRNFKTHAASDNCNARTDYLFATNSHITSSPLAIRLQNPDIYETPNENIAYFHRASCLPETPCDGSLKTVVLVDGNAHRAFMPPDPDTTGSWYTERIHEKYKNDNLQYGKSIDTSCIERQNALECDSSRSTYDQLFIQAYGMLQCVGPVTMIMQSTYGSSPQYHADLITGSEAAVEAEGRCHENNASTFIHPMRSVTESKVAFNSAPPSTLKLTYGCASPDEKILQCIYFPYPQKYDVYCDIISVDTYVQPQRITGSYLARPQCSNFYDENTKLLCLVLAGGTPVFVVQMPSVRICVNNLEVDCPLPYNGEEYIGMIAEIAGVGPEFVSFAEDNTCNDQNICFIIAPLPNTRRLEDAMNFIEGVTSTLTDNIQCGDLSSIEGTSSNVEYFITESLDLLNKTSNTGATSPESRRIYKGPELVIDVPTPQIYEGQNLTDVVISVQPREDSPVTVGSRRYPWNVACEVYEPESQLYSTQKLETTLDEKTGKGSLDPIEVPRHQANVRLVCKPTKPICSHLSGESNHFQVLQRVFTLNITGAKCFKVDEEFVITATLYENDKAAENLNWKLGLDWSPSFELLVSIEKKNNIRVHQLSLTDGTASVSIKVKKNMNAFRFEYIIKSGGTSASVYEAKKIGGEIKRCSSETNTGIETLVIISVPIVISFLNSRDQLIGTRKKRDIGFLPSNIVGEDMGGGMVWYNKEAVHSRRKRQTVVDEETAYEEVSDQLADIFQNVTIEGLIITDSAIMFSITGQEDFVDETLLELTQAVQSRTLELNLNGQPFILAGDLTVDGIAIVVVESTSEKFNYIYIIIIVIVIILLVILIILIIFLCYKCTKRGSAVAADSPEPDEEDQDLPPSLRGSRIAFAETGGPSGGGVVVTSGAGKSGQVLQRPASSRAASSQSTRHTPDPEADNMPDVK